MFTAEDKDELIRRRPATAPIDLDGGSHDAHVDTFARWADVLTGWFARREPRSEA